MRQDFFFKVFLKVITATVLSSIVTITRYTIVYTYLVYMIYLINACIIGLVPYAVCFPRSLFFSVQCPSKLHQ